MDIQKRKKEILFSREDIKKRVEELGKEITEEYKDKKLLVISLLKGSFIFTSDLVRELEIPVKIEFMATSSYGKGKESSGHVEITQDLKGTIEDYDVLVVDDIADTGLTMKFVLQYLKDKKPASIKSCVLLNKPSRRQTKLEPDYIGFTIPDRFIVGYGLNYGDYYRNMPYVFTFIE